MYVAKYVDDLTLIETVPTSVETSIDSSPNRPHHTIKPKVTQESFNKIKNAAEQRGLKINDSKTQF